MAIRKRHKHGAEVPTHSLNDIMFFLLLFFLIIATLANPNVIKIITAKASSTVSKEKQKNYDLVVTIEKEYFYNSEKITIEELEKRLIIDVKNDDKMLLAVDIDNDVDIQEMVDVLSLCRKCNVKYYLKDNGKTVLR